MKVKFSWNDYYNLAKKYYEKNGDSLIPSKYIVKIKLEDGSIEKVSLGRWIIKQRRRYFGKSHPGLSYEELDLLKSIEMVWDVNNFIWNRNYNLAKEYYEKNGHLLIPKNYVVKIEKGNGTTEIIYLGRWIEVQRSAYKGNCNNKISYKKIKLLEEICMIWEVNNESIVMANSYSRTWKKKYDLFKNII